jgi:hypothetical protein
MLYPPGRVLREGTGYSVINYILPYLLPVRQIIFNKKYDCGSKSKVKTYQDLQRRENVYLIPPLIACTR